MALALGNDQFTDPSGLWIVLDPDSETQEAHRRCYRCNLRFGFGQFEPHLIPQQSCQLSLFLFCRSQGPFFLVWTIRHMNKNDEIIGVSDRKTDGFPDALVVGSRFNRSLLDTLWISQDRTIGILAGPDMPSVPLFDDT